MKIVIGCTTVAYKMERDPMFSQAWLVNAERVAEEARAAGHEVAYFAALETDARGLAPFAPLLHRFAELEGRGIATTHWTFHLDDGAERLTTANRLRRICMGHNLVIEYALQAGADAVLFLASDTQCRDDVLPRLLELEVPVAASHITTYCLDGPKVDGPEPSKMRPHVPPANWSASGWDVRVHMETCACMLIRREVLDSGLRWRTDGPKGLTDDPAMHYDLYHLLGEQVYSRHDVLATHYPAAIPCIEGRHTDEERRYHR